MYAVEESQGTGSFVLRIAGCVVLLLAFVVASRRVLPLAMARLVLKDKTKVVLGGWLVGDLGTAVVMFCLFCCVAVAGACLCISSIRVYVFMLVGWLATTKLACLLRRCCVAVASLLRRCCWSLPL